MGAAPLYLVIILARENAYSRDVAHEWYRMMLKESQFSFKKRGGMAVLLR